MRTGRASLPVNTVATLRLSDGHDDPSGECDRRQTLSRMQLVTPDNPGAPIVPIGEDLWTPDEPLEANSDV